MVGTWLGEIHSCSCLAVLLDTAWVLLNKIYQPFFTSLYGDPNSFPTHANSLTVYVFPSFCRSHDIILKATTLNV